MKENKTEYLAYRVIDWKGRSPIFMNYFNSSIETIDLSTDDKESKPHLLFKTKIAIENYDQMLDVNMMTRSDFMVGLSLVSYCSDKYVGATDVIFQGTTDDVHILPFKYTEIKPSVEDVKSNKAITDSLETSNDKGILISALDQFRKAAYLDYSISNGEHLEEESMLAYFKVLEILVNNFYDEMKEIILTETSNFVMGVSLTKLFVQGLSSLQLTEERVKLVQSQMTGFIHISSKIKYMAFKLDLLTDSILEFIDEFTLHRNQIAHGRTTYKSKISFPAPAFFTSSDYKYFDASTLRQFCGSVLDKQFGVSIYINSFYGIIASMDKSVNAILYYLVGASDEDEFTYDPKFPIDTIAYYVVIGKIKPRKVKNYLIHVFSEKIEFENQESISILSAMAGNFLPNEYKAVAENIVSAYSSTNSGIFWYRNFKELYSDADSRGINLPFLKRILSENLAQ